MTTRYHWLLAGAIAFAGIARGQEKATPVAKAEGNAIEVRFADDSHVKMVLQTSSIDVVTRYGRLTVPTSDIRRIEFGERPAPAPGEKPRPPRPDTVVTYDFTIMGRVEAPELKAKSPYFGEATLKIAELRSIRWLGDARETKVSVDAASYGAQNEKWLDTGIDVRGGAQLSVVASGTVDLNPTPGEAGTNVVGPDGRSPRGTARGGGGFAAGGGPGGGGPGGGGPAGFARGDRGSFPARSGPGALIARIGENGRTFVIGSRFEGLAPDDGKLYVRIVPSNTGAESSGSYDVRVTTGR
jgi:hypothetical protein